MPSLLPSFGTLFPIRVQCLKLLKLEGNFRKSLYETNDYTRKVAWYACIYMYCVVCIVYICVCKIFFGFDDADNNNNSFKCMSSISSCMFTLTLVSFLKKVIDKVGVDVPLRFLHRNREQNKKSATTMRWRRRNKKKKGKREKNTPSK